MSATVEKRVDGRGDAGHVEMAWELKERIRAQDGVLKQRRGFFVNAYRRADCHLLAADDDLVGFAAARQDGYILFLAVAPEMRSRGYGETLVAEVANDHRTVTCHARASNRNALDFYRHIGFETERRIENYYEDGGDAYYLKLGEDQSIADKLSDFMRR
ncbi:MAG: GNAT family N-acetyltransferase [Halolamina sp.]